MHPDKVPEPFRDLQKLKVLDLQCSTEIARTTLEHSDWESVDVEVIQEREDPRKAQKCLQIMLNKLPENDATKPTKKALDKFTVCPANGIPEPVCYVARCLGKQVPSLATILMALEPLV